MFNLCETSRVLIDEIYIILPFFSYLKQGAMKVATLNVFCYCTITFTINVYIVL